MTQKKYRWAKQTMAKDCMIVNAPSQDPIHDFKRDPSGYYVLIRVNRDEDIIETALCDKDHVIRHVFRGSTAQDVYAAVFAQEKILQQAWLTRKDHIAYLGKELWKAESALREGSGYIQE